MTDEEILERLSRCLFYYETEQNESLFWLKICLHTDKNYFDGKILNLLFFFLNVCTLKSEDMESKNITVTQFLYNVKSSLSNNSEDMPSVSSSLAGDSDEKPVSSGCPPRVTCIRRSASNVEHHLLLHYYSFSAHIVKLRCCTCDVFCVFVCMCGSLCPLQLSHYFISAFSLTQGAL